VSELRTKNFGHRNRKALPTKPHCQNPPVILQSKMPAPFPRGPYADCTAHLPPSLREVAFAKQKTEGVYLLINATPPVTAYAATAPSVREPRVHAFPCSTVPQRTAHPLRLTVVRHLPFARRGGFADCAARIPRHFAMQNDCPLYRGAFLILHRSEKASCFSPSPALPDKARRDGFSFPSFRARMCTMHILRQRFCSWQTQKFPDLEKEL